MAEARITWTALPHGAGPDGPRLSVAVSLRLGDPTGPAGGTLADYPAFLDWPAVLAGVRFGLVTDGGVGWDAGDLQPDPATAARPDSRAWVALFPPTSPVRPFAFTDHSVRGVRTLPVRETVGYAQGLYGEVARTSGTDLPRLDSGPLQRLVGDLGFVRPLLAGREGQRGERMPGPPEPGSDPRRRVPRVLPATARGSATAAFVQAARFYSRPENRLAPGYDPPHVDDVTTPAAPDFDLHTALAGLTDSPTLMRVFGLVVDLVLPDLPRGRHLRVVPVWDGGLPGDVREATPWTAVQEEPFLPRPLDPEESADGLLRLTGVDDDLRDVERLARRRYDLVQVDPDGTALKLVHVADTGRRVLTGLEANAVAYDTPQDAGLPALQTAGLALVRHGRDAVAAEATIASAVREAAPVRGPEDLGEVPFDDDVVLHAEDVTRGYRVDVADESEGRWRSLCRRTGTWTVRRAGEPDVVVAGDVVEEGYAKETPATAQGDATSDLYLGETVARWVGWSLAAPRPGRTVVGRPGARARDEDEARLGQATLPTQTEHVVDPEPELHRDFPLAPALRPEAGSLPALRYGHSYRLRARLVDLAGNSVEDGHDDLGSDPVTYRRFEPVVPPAVTPRAPYREGASLERLVVRSDLGVLPAAYAAANPGRPGEPPIRPTDERHLTPPKAAAATVETAGLLDEAFGPGGDRRAAYDLVVREAHTLTELVTVDPADLDVLQRTDLPGVVRVPGHDPAGTGDTAGTYVLLDTESPVLAYLPDPWALGAALQVQAPEPGWTPGWLLPWEREGGVWHQPRAFRLVVGDPAEVTATPDATTGELVVALPQAEVVVVRLSSLPDLRRVADESGVWAWAADDGLRVPLEEGRLWPVSPFRTLTLVHAVQHPLAPARLVEVLPQRQRGATTAELPAVVNLDVKSTGTLDVAAAWSDWFDGGPTGTEKPPGRAHVAQLDVERALALPGPAPQPRDLRLTRRGPVPLDLQLRRVPPVVQEFGDTRHRLVTYSTRATTPFREYFPPAVAQDVEQLSSPWVDAEPVHVPSSERPAAPKPRYAVPTWRWEGADPAAGWTDRVERVRHGGGLRVWMDRPWWSSGEDELLGVVLREGRTQDVPERLVPLVTRLGRDPFWDVPAPRTTLSPASFAGLAPLGAASGLQLAEAAGLDVSVAAVAPAFDPERGLWFADLELPSAAVRSYMPFLRAALARYQPFSVPGAELSRVVVLDPVQLLPDRRLRLDRAGAGLDVSLSGPAPEGNAVSVTLEVHDGVTPGELGWAAAPGTTDRPNPLWLSDEPPPRWQVSPDLRDRLDRLAWRVPAPLGEPDPGPVVGRRLPLSRRLRLPDTPLRDALLLDPLRGHAGQLLDRTAVLASDETRLPVAARSVVLDRPQRDALPSVGRYLEPEQLSLLRAVAGADREGAGAAERLGPLLEGLTPAFAAPVGETHVPEVGPEDLRAWYADLAVDLDAFGVALPAFALPGWRTWSGHLRVPDDGRAYRVVVQEHEYAPTDEVLFRIPFLDVGEVTVLGSRVVYADTVRL